MAFQLSEMRIYSIGLVAIDKELDSREIEVFPIEVLSDYSGTLDNVEELDTEVKLGNEGVEKLKIENRPTIKATWLALGNSNRITPPDVKKGETVLIFQYSDVDKYYWVKIFNEIDLRRKERVIYMYGNTDIFNIPLNSNNSYWFMVDTINKKVALHTSENDGEYTKYDFFFDTKEGIMKIEDGKQNMIELNSKDDTLTIKLNENVNIINKNETHTVEENTIYYTNKFAIKNDTIELISLLIEYIQTHIEEQHIGNLGVPTELTSESKNKFIDIMNRLATLKV